MVKLKNKYLKKLLFIIISNFFYFIGIPQNLVSNPSFENITNCPTSHGQLEYAVGWMNPVMNIDATPDLFHTCSSVMGVPNCCGTQFQYPKTGNAFTQVITYNGNFNNIREYIQSTLIDSLITNKCYFFSMYVNSYNNASYSTNNLGVYFSDDKIESTNLLLNYVPQIFTSSIIYDTLNWVQISGTYKPSSNNKYITIGNFFDDNQTDTLINFLDLVRSSSYLIDEIALYQLGSGYTGKDSTIRIGDSIFLGQDVENLPSTWRTIDGTVIANNVSGVLVSPTETTTYVCEQNFCGEVMYDTITVTVVDDVGLQSEKQNESGVRIYPNPNHGSFELLNPLADEVFFELYNTVGQLVYSQKTKDKNSKIELRLERGVYFATFNKRLYSQKIVIQ